MALTVGPESLLKIELGGTEIGEYDRLEIDGTAMLDGTLRVELIDLDGGTFIPQLGDQFAILAAGGGVGGSFDSLELPSLALGLAWELNPGGVTLFLDVVSNLAGDYNGDGSVDAADYTVWRDNLGAPPGTLANDSTGGAIGQAQYDVWRANFGATAGIGSSSASSQVPEPKVAVMVTLGIAMLSRVYARAFSHCPRCPIQTPRFMAISRSICDARSVSIESTVGVARWRFC